MNVSICWDAKIITHEEEMRHECGEKFVREAEIMAGLYQCQRGRKRAGRTRRSQVSELRASSE